MVSRAKQVHAQQTDPYAAGQSAYVQETIKRYVDDLLGQTRTVYNAVGCNVVSDVMAKIVLDQSAVNLVTQMRLSRADYETLRQLMADARLAGLAEAGHASGSPSLVRRSKYLGSSNLIQGFILRGQSAVASFWPGLSDEVAA